MKQLDLFIHESVKVDTRNQYYIFPQKKVAIQRNAVSAQRVAQFLYQNDLWNVDVEKVPLEMHEKGTLLKLGYLVIIPERIDWSELATNAGVDTPRKKRFKAPPVDHRKYVEFV